MNVVHIVLEWTFGAASVHNIYEYSLYPEYSVMHQMVQYST